MGYPFQDSIKRNKNEMILGNAEINRNMEEEDIVEIVSKVGEEDD